MVKAFLNGVSFSAPYKRIETQARLRVVLSAIHTDNRVSAYNTTAWHPIAEDDTEGFDRLSDRIKLIDPDITLVKSKNDKNTSFDKFYDQYVALFGVPGTDECKQRVEAYYKNRKTR